MSAGWRGGELNHGVSTQKRSEPSPKRQGTEQKTKKNKTWRHGSKLSGSHLGDDGVEAALSPRVVPGVGVQHPTPIRGGGNSKELLQPPKKTTRRFCRPHPSSHRGQQEAPGWLLGKLVLSGARAALATHQEKGCCEPGSAELAKNPAKICWIILRAAKKGTG